MLVRRADRESYSSVSDSTLLLLLGLAFAAVRYGGGSGWWIFVAVVLSLLSLGAGAWLSDWRWRPFREAQEQARRARTDKDGT